MAAPTGYLVNVFSRGGVLPGRVPAESCDSLLASFTSAVSRAEYGQQALPLAVNDALVRRDDVKRCPARLRE